MLGKLSDHHVSEIPRIDLALIDRHDQPISVPTKPKWPDCCRVGQRGIRWERHQVVPHPKAEPGMATGLSMKSVF